MMEQLPSVMVSKVNNSLQELNMSSNGITSEGAKKIAEAIQVNTALHTLDLYGIAGDDETIL